MKLSEIRNSYYGYSGKSSDVSRSAAFAGIALVWIFKTPIEGQIELPVELLYPAMALVIALALDLLHYVVSALLWGVLGYWVETKISHEPETEFDVSKYINWPGIVFFWLKLAAVLTGYYLLLLYVYKTINFA